MRKEEVFKSRPPLMSRDRCPLVSSPLSAPVPFTNTGPRGCSLETRSQKNLENTAWHIFLELNKLKGLRSPLVLKLVLG